ncbi:MAG TPA: formyltransferase family protein [Gemmatimonadaceae bacterium]|nr:formyltransferase family protein [Gemmatimonadaceae bacterium]
MRVVLLTETAGPAMRALLQLGLRAITVATVVVAARPMVSVAAETAAAIRRRSGRRVLGTALRRLASAVDPPARFLGSGQFDGLAERVVVTESLNSPATIQSLESARPDLLLLTATALVDSSVLAVPALGTLNSHPGLVPWIRGNGAVEHAILRRVPVGVSVHHVDEGADTGDILRRELVPIIASDTLGSIQQKAEEVRWMALADVTAQFVSGSPPRRVPQTRRLQSVRWPTAAERTEAQRLVTEGDAYRRYCAWRDIAGGDLLPPDDAAFDRATST